MPVVYEDIEQGTPEWHSLRAGIPTSSEFDNLITPVKGDPTSKKKFNAYAAVKAMEIYLKENIGNDFANEWMDRGKVLENQAADQYEIEYNVDTRKVGFITDDKGYYGFSPDRLTDCNGGLEIKCFKIEKHCDIWFSKKVDDKNICQVQGQLMIGELDYVDYWIYHPRVPPRRIRVTRDEKFIKVLEKQLVRFREKLAENVDILIKEGLIEV